MYRSCYKGFGSTLASEKLLERERLEVCDETLRLWLIEEALWQSKKRKVRKDYSWCQRKDHLGEMVQMDGSIHIFYEGKELKHKLRPKKRAKLTEEEFVIMET